MKIFTGLLQHGWLCLNSTHVFLTRDPSSSRAPPQNARDSRMLPEPPRGAVILFDRGVVDNVAYCTEAANGSNTIRKHHAMSCNIQHLVTWVIGSLFSSKAVKERIWMVHDIARVLYRSLCWQTCQATLLNKMFLLHGAPG